MCCFSSPPRFPKNVFACVKTVCECDSRWGDPAGLVVTVGWTLNMTLCCFVLFFPFFCFSLFTVSFELTTGSLILLLLLLLYFIQMFYCYFRYNSPLSGMPKSLCMCVCFKLCADNHGHVELYTINPVLTSNISVNFNSIHHFIKQ